MARGKGDLGSINASLKSEPEFITVQGVDVTESLAFAAPPPVEDTTEGVGNPFRVLMTILLPLPFEASGLLIITARRFLPLREDIFETEEEALFIGACKEAVFSWPRRKYIVVVYVEGILFFRGDG